MARAKSLNWLICALSLLRRIEWRHPLVGECANYWGFLPSLRVTLARGREPTVREQTRPMPHAGLTSDYWCPCEWPCKGRQRAAAPGRRIAILPGRIDTVHRRRASGPWGLSARKRLAGLGRHRAVSPVLYPGCHGRSDGHPFLSAGDGQGQGQGEAHSHGGFSWTRRHRLHGTDSGIRPTSGPPKLREAEVEAPVSSTS